SIAGNAIPNSAEYAARPPTPATIRRWSGERRDLSVRRRARSALRDLVAHDLAGAERHDAPRCDRHFDAGLRIAADSLTLVAQDERAETRKLDVLPLGKRVTHVMKNTLDDAG